jgi:hypothetical protein
VFKIEKKKKTNVNNCNFFFYNQQQQQQQKGQLATIREPKTTNSSKGVQYLHHFGEHRLVSHVGVPHGRRIEIAMQQLLLDQVTILCISLHKCSSFKV